MTRVALALCFLPASAAALRPDTPGTTELFRYESDDVVESFDTTSFRVHFTRAGTNAVPIADADASGFPDHVERVGAIYEDVLAFYAGELGFRAPLADGSVGDNGGDARFDVYLLDFGGSADGAFRTDACLTATCVGFMVQENDFAGYGYPSIDYANRLLASHELFHAVQAAYDASEGSVIGEGTAVWASEAYDPRLNDLEGFAHGYLDLPDRPIDRPLPGPIDPFSYGASIFFRFLEERFGRDVIRSLWEACETDDWMPALDALLIGDHASSFADAFREFVEWNLFTGPRADPSRSYADGADYPLVQIEPVSLPRSTGPLRVFYASAQYYGADPGARSSVTAALTGDAAGLELLFAVRRGDAIEISAGASADTAGADEVIVVVRNPAREGDSVRPGLCIGDAAEVEACVAAMTPQPDAGVAADAGTMSASDAGPPVETGGCGCRASERSTPSWLALLALLALRRRQ